ncbi:MAG: DUF2232 domain-containing protein [Rhodospirillaceae bacterium]|nr:DUF2232 domain-containing protein [Rhodospirillaceae bacterium]
MSKDMLIAIGGGTLSAFASLAFMSGMPGALLAVYLAPLPLLLVGLDHGIKAATAAGLSGIIVTGLIGGAMSGVLFSVIHALPAWIIVRQGLLKLPAADGKTEEWYPVGSILCILSVFCTGLLTVAMFWSLGEDGGLHDIVQSYLGLVFAYMMPTMDEVVRGDLVQTISPLFPGYMGTSWVVMAAVNASIAAAILTRAKRFKRPKSKLADLSLPDWMSWFLIAAAVMALLGQGELEFFGRNLALILAVPFFFLGLGVVHELARHVQFPGTLLAAFYFVMFLSGWIAMAVILAGLLEQWVGLRRRFMNPGPDRNDEDDN